MEVLGLVLSFPFEWLQVAFGASPFFFVLWSLAWGAIGWGLAIKVRAKKIEHDVKERLDYKELEAEHERRIRRQSQSEDMKLAWMGLNARERKAVAAAWDIGKASKTLNVDFDGLADVTMRALVQRGIAIDAGEYSAARGLAHAYTLSGPWFLFAEENSQDMEALVELVKKEGL